MPQSPSKWVTWDLTQSSQHLFHCSKGSAISFIGIAISCPCLPRRIFLNLINHLKSLPFQGWFQFGEKPEVTGHKIWLIGSGLNRVISNCSTVFLLLWQQRSQETNFAMTCLMPRSCVKISETVVFGIPRSASSSPTATHQSLLIAARTRSTFSGVLLVAGLPEHGSLSTDSQPSLKHLCHAFICAALIASSLKAF